VSEAPTERTFTSWKEIAQFFDRDIRTVQRWEKEEGLPVHRHLHQKQSSVYAHDAELEAWRRERGALMEASAPAARSAPGSGWRKWAAAAGTVAAVGILVWWGLLNGIGADPQPGFAVTTLEGTRPGSGLIGAHTGDLNGDGVGDFVLNAGEAREVYLYFGGKLPASGAEIPPSANVILSGDPRGGLNVTQVADFNGDGLSDLFLSTNLDEPEAYRETGKSFIVLGRRTWARALSLPKDADVTFWFDIKGDVRMGGCKVFNGAQDLNGDGIDDVLLALLDWGPERPSAGLLVGLWGRKKWPEKMDISRERDFSILGARSGEGLGYPCVVGDFNGDRTADLGVVGTDSRLWGALGGRARFYLFAGRDAWPKNMDANTDFEFRVDGVREKAFWMTPALADVNGDGEQDLILGWPDPRDSGDYAGEVQIWFGGKNRKGVAAADAADVRILGDVAGDGLGVGLVTNDMDGDGIQDLVVAAFGPGNLYLIYGQREWKKQGKLDEYAPLMLLDGETSLGYEKIGIDDLDADGLPEIVATSPWSDTRQARRGGRAWILKPQLPVAVDVRPGREPNVILPRGLVVVRVQSDAPSASDPIDPATLRLAGAPPTFHRLSDFDGDGRQEFQVHFDMRALKISPDATHITLTGRTRSGRPVAGSDSIVVMPSGGRLASDGAAAKQVPTKK
jgi:hypothetical protein